MGSQIATFPGEALNPYIDLPFIQPPAYTPAEQGKADRKEERAEIGPGMGKDILIDPGIPGGAILSVKGVQQNNHQFTEQVNKQGIFAYDLKEIGPLVLFVKRDHRAGAKGHDET